MPAPPSHRGALGRLLAACAIVFACFAAGVVAVGANELHATARALEAQPRVDLGGALTSTTSGGPTASGNGRTILLIGSDHRARAAKHNARSDTMMLVRLSPRAKAVTVLSIPRDLKVTIKGQDRQAQRRLRLGRRAADRQDAALGARDRHRPRDRRRLRRLPRAREPARVRLHRRRPPLLQPQRRHRRHQLRLDRHAGRLPAPVRRRRARLRPLPPRRQRPRARRPPAGLPAPGPRADRCRRPARRPPRAAAPARREHPHRHPRLQADHRLDQARRSAPPTSPSSRCRSPPPSAPRTSRPRRRRSATTVRRFLHPSVATAKAPSAAAARQAQAGGPRHRASWPPPRRRPSTPRSASSTPPAAAPARPTTASARTRSRTRRARATPPTGCRSAPALGEYYGVQGTDWTDPPILAAPDAQRTLGNRTFDLYYDGRHLRRVALRTSEGSWWVTNTLTLSLTNAQMLAIARSLRARVALGA